MSYAITVYELGLYNSMDVVRCAVYITKNPMLCFTQTINWIRIAPPGKESHGIHLMTTISWLSYLHGIYDNRLVNICPVCP